MKFRSVGTIDIPPLEAWVYSEFRINLDVHRENDVTRLSLSVDKARELRDWLNKVLPCDHTTRFTGWRLADPFGKSDAKVEVTNECVLCHESVPQRGTNE